MTTSFNLLCAGLEAEGAVEMPQHRKGWKTYLIQRARRRHFYHVHCNGALKRGGIFDLALPVKPDHPTYKWLIARAEDVVHSFQDRVTLEFARVHAMTLFEHRMFNGG